MSDPYYNAQQQPAGYYNPQAPQQSYYVAQQPAPGYYAQPQPYYSAQQAPPQAYYAEQPKPQAAIYSQQQPVVQPNASRFAPTSQYRDVWASALWIASLGAVGFLCYRNVQQFKDNGGSINSGGSNADDSHTVQGWGLILGVTCGVMIAFSFAWLQFLRKYARQMIIATNVAAAVLSIILGIYCLAAGNAVAGIISFVFGAFSLLWLYLVRDRIPYAKEILKSAVSIIDHYPATVAVSLGGLLVSCAFMGLWLTAFTFAYYNQNKVDIYVLVFCMYWTTQVLHNIVYVTTAGVVSTWYFSAGMIPENPTFKSLKRAVTTSLGSICFGSLIVAVIQFLKFVFNSAKNQKNEFVRCLVNCILNMLESLAEMFNTFAFVQVAVYGKGFMDASRDTISLLKSNGIDIIIGEDLISPVLTFGCLIGGLFAALCSGGLQHLIYHHDGVIVAIVGFILGYVIMTMFMSCVFTATLTLYVCFAEDGGEAMLRLLPDMHSQIIARRGIHGGSRATKYGA